MEYRSLIFHYGGFKGEEFIWKKGFTRARFKLGQQVESHSCCWFCFLPTDHLIWHLRKEFQQNNLQKFKCPAREGGSSMLKLRNDQCLFLGNSGPITFLSPYISSWAKTWPQKCWMGRTHLRKVLFLLT